jgi:hypothetical protein
MTEAEQERTPVQDMTDRAIAEETLILLRAFQDAFMAVAGNPMMAAMIPTSMR